MVFLILSKFHIVFAGMWLISLIAYPLLRRTVIHNKNKIGEKKFISLYLIFANLLGMIGGIGILVTGIFMVLDNPLYGFFQITANHWLTAKQILMVALLILLFTGVIPTSKKIRNALGTNFENNDKPRDEVYVYLAKLFKLNAVMNMIILINFLLAITHNFIN